jgi:hypothetical protein
VLNIKLYREDDGTAGLSACVLTGDFSGSGTAWFNLTEIEEYSRKVKLFAETLENPPNIAGGYYDLEGNLENTLLSFRMYLISRRGYIGFLVELANHPYTSCRPEEISRVSVELKTTPQSLIDFSNGIDQLIRGNVDEVVLKNAT